MVADILPTYQQAVSRGDWVQLAAPYIAFTDYPALCCVSRHFWSVFAPRIWRDPYTSSKLLGWSEESDTISWWVAFVAHKLDKFTAQTRALVRVLDARGPVGGHSFNMYLGLTDEAVERALDLLPNVDCLFLDDHPGLSMRFLRRIPPRASGSLRMLSVPNCRNGIPAALISGGCLQGLVYLDISRMPKIPFQTLETKYLPELRILKLRQQGIRDPSFPALAGLLRRRLWSLDLSDNKLTDAALENELLGSMFYTNELRSEAHAQAEGSLVSLPIATARHGLFRMLRESAQSALFLPGERYLGDAPPYATINVDNNMTRRSDGSVPMRTDTLDDVLRLLSRDDGMIATSHSPGSEGLTHLHLSGNQFSAVAVEKMLRTSAGRLEHFDCDSMRLFPPSNPTTSHILNPSIVVKLDGFSGMWHIFRPVWSSNLRSLRIHHSLVTNIPTLEVPGHFPIEHMYLAEMQLLPKLDRAYPLAFVPDMNPRLESLTLTCVPRHSFGPLVQKLALFLRRLGMQECILATTKEAEASLPGKSLRLVRGLRQLTLEMGPDLLPPLDVDVQELLTSGEAPFSFFDRPEEHHSAPPQESPPLRPPQERPPLRLWSYPMMSPTNPGSIAVHPSAAYNPALLESPNRDYSKEQWVIHWPEEYTNSTMVVWAGNPASPNAIIKVYNHLVIKCSQREGAGPVNLTQKNAGAPEECIIFHTTWLFASLPQQIRSLPLTTLRDTVVSKDVAATLHRLRVSTFEDFEREQKLEPNNTYWYWGGTLKIIDAPPNEDDDDFSLGMR
ncbi:hypothetical protein ACHAQJ_009159 [Trichoderma viride]